MKGTKKFLALVLALVLSVTMLPATDANAASKKVKLNKTKATIYVGKTVTLKLKNNKKKVKWKTSNKKVATVSKSGKVKGKKAGKAVIKAKVGKKSYKCKITVKKSKKKKANVISTKPSAKDNVINEYPDDSDDDDDIIIPAPEPDQGEQYGDWRIKENDDSITIVGYTGEETTVTIPDEIKGKPVTTIGENAFWAMTAITDIIIPNSVTAIEDGAFYHCEGLENVKLSQNLRTIGENVYDFCCKVKEIEIPASVTSIGSKAFGDLCIYKDNFTNNSNLDSKNAREWGIKLYDREENGLCILDGKVLGVVDKSVTEYNIPNDITAIDESAFEWSKVVTVTIPDSVKSIGQYAFSQCISLENVNIPNGITEIGGFTFWGCAKVKSFTIPDSVKSIGEEAFYLCKSLKSIRIPASVESIGNRAFALCNTADVPEDEPVLEENNLEIIGKSGSVAETWAKKNNFKFTAE